MGFLELTGNLIYLTFFLSINFVNSPPLQIKKDLQWKGRNLIE